jgi:mannose-1-phosphate guanylyltransferase
VDEVICSSPYLESRFHPFLESRHGMRPSVRWITEARPLGTAGAIAGARPLLDETFVALNGDILTDLDLGALIRFHRERGAVATIALTPVEDARPFGLVEMEPTGRVVAFREKPAERVPGAINAGVYVLEPRALAEVPAEVMVSIERETYPDLISRGQPVYAALAGGYWRDLGTPADYLQAHVDALRGRLASYRDLPAPLLGRGARIDPDAVVGTDVVLGDGATVGAGATVDRSVLHRGAVVEEGAAVASSILGPGAVVGAGAEVRHAVLAEAARVALGGRVEGQGVRPGRVAPAQTGG